MPTASVTLRRLFLATAAASSVAACSSSTEASSIAGSYKATTFLVTPTGESTIDVLAAGGTLSVTIASNNSTIATLTVPASLNGGEPLVESVNGTAVRSGNTVQFQLGSDTFVRDLQFTVTGNTLQTVNQTAGDASYTITLTRQ